MQELIRQIRAAVLSNNLILLHTHSKDLHEIFNREFVICSLRSAVLLGKLKGVSDMCERLKLLYQARPTDHPPPWPVFTSAVMNSCGINMKCDKAALGRMLKSAHDECKGSILNFHDDIYLRDGDTPDGTTYCMQTAYGDHGPDKGNDEEVTNPDVDIFVCLPECSYDKDDSSKYLAAIHANIIALTPQKKLCFLDLNDDIQTRKFGERFHKKIKTLRTHVFPLPFDLVIKLLCPGGKASGLFDNSVYLFECTNDESKQRIQSQFKNIDIDAVAPRMLSYLLHACNYIQENLAESTGCVFEIAGDGTMVMTAPSIPLSDIHRPSGRD